MSAAPNFEMTASKVRRFWDRAAKLLVTAGGVSALLMLVLIFIYLVIIIAPTIKKPSVELDFSSSSDTWHSGSQYVATLASSDEVYRVDQSGRVTFFSLAPNIVEQHTIRFPEVTSFAAPSAGSSIMAFGHQSGDITVFEPTVRDKKSFRSGDTNSAIEYPLGGSILTLDLERQPIDRLSVSMLGNQFTAVGQTQDHRWVGLRVIGDVNPITYETEWEQVTFSLDLPEQPTAFALTPDGGFLYVLSDNQLLVYSSTGSGFELRESLMAGTDDAPASALAVLPGASSVVTASHQSVQQWFDVRDASGTRSLTRIRQYPLAGQGEPQFVVEQYRKSFMTVQPDGHVGLYYTTSRKPLLQTQMPLPSGQLLGLSFSPYGDRLTALYEGELQQMAVHNPHPEVTLSSLFEKVWYEGYPEPEYVWQSTPGSEQFEPKMSLVPLIFGTLKSALVAMLISVPLAVSGAVYTAYFMSTRMRAVVKPTIELMEALPTVILGFLAGIWLAPMIEVNLSALLLMVFAIPLVTLCMGLLWWWLPQRFGWQIPNGLHVILLAPVLILVIWGCFGANDWIESLLFAGDARLYLSREWGVGFDQRNAIVIGVAMGFAVIPTVFTISEDAIYSVPRHLTSGSLALGATHWQTLSRVVLITASPGIFSAIMMGVGRAIGETMIVLMATGNTPIMEMNLLQGMRTLAANIAIEMPESEVGSSHYRVLFLSALVLFVFTFVFNTLAEVVRQRLREKYSNL